MTDRPNAPTTPAIVSATEAQHRNDAKQGNCARARSKGGRPTAYREEYAEEARKLCLLGATDLEMADLFGVSEVTINAWKKRFPEFLKSITRGKLMADAEVAEKLYQRACGYSHPGVKIMQYEGQPIEVEYIQHYPPDTQAASLWLRNRQPAKWRDVQKGDRDHTTAVTLSLEEQDRLAKERMDKFWAPVLELEAQQLAAEAEQERQDQLRAGGAPYEQTDPTH